MLSVNPATGKAGSASPAALVAARNVIQSTLVNGSRLGIPASFSQEALHSATQGGTVFPELVTQGSSWDPSLVEAIAAAIAVEARATGVDVAFSPVLNQWVDARFGRLQEGFSENPTVRLVCCCSRTSTVMWVAWHVGSKGLPRQAATARRCCAIEAFTKSVSLSLY